MFKVSQEIYLNSSDSANHSSTYGKYQRLSDDDSYLLDDRKVFVSPEITETRKIQLLHFPTEKLCVDEAFNFVLIKNAARGNLAAKLIAPSGKSCELPLQILDPDRLGVRVLPTEMGIYKIHLKLNAVELPQSPLRFEAVYSSAENTVAQKLPVFRSDASQIKYRGLGLHQISINEKNEFTIDASSAGNNILFIGICGPDGQCDEVAVKHLGENVYHVIYRVHRRGPYAIVAKWGDDHIPDSPFALKTN